VQLNESYEGEQLGIDALNDLFHRYLTGLILAMVVELGEDRAAGVMKGLFRRQQGERFLPGLKKLGLSDEPDAVACAKYHFLSNHVGGVSVAYIAESDTKAWIRYLPPRWIFDGTAIAAIPTQVARAMLWGWHANNGVLLGNPRLGFVCTGQTMDGAPGLEGYYIEEDRTLEPYERLRFRFGESCPAIDYEALPKLDSQQWPSERLNKAARNYAMDYIRNIVPVMCEELGPLVAQGVLYRTGRQIGMQYSEAIRTTLGLENPVEVLGALFRAQGDDISVRENEITQTTWKLMNGLEAESLPDWMDGLRGLWEGVVSVTGPDLRLDLLDRLDTGGNCFRWRCSVISEPSKY
jgi:hypothetical protein